MENGIYNDLSFDEYLSDKAISRSGILQLNRTPFHFMNMQVKNTTASMKIGTALHAKILEPHLFHQRYAIEEKFDKRTLIGRDKQKEYIENLAGKAIITGADWVKINGMYNSLLSMKNAIDLLRNSKKEVSIFWEDESEILCKCRPDALNDKFVVDLKTSKDASEKSFKRDVEEYGYHIQAAMIQEAVHVLRGTWINDFFYIVVENSAPYAPAIYTLCQASIDKGRQIFKDNLAVYKKCMELNEWPSYESKEITIWGV